MNQLFPNTFQHTLTCLTSGELRTTPIRIKSIEILRIRRDRLRLPFLKRGLNNDVYIIRSRSTDGVVGIAVAHDYIQYLYPILQRLIIPYFLGKDVRDLKDLLDGVYRFRSNYKLAGLALWCCIAWVEISLLDLLGKYLQKPIVEVLGGQLIDKVPVYLSSVRRDTTPEQEIAWIEKRLKETGARVVKFKIGGRMSMNIDAMPKRTETLVMRARKTFGDQITLGVDGNGSFDAKHGIEIGKFLESFGVAFFEEPCPFDDFAATERVTKSLNLTITGGEQETSLARFEYMARHGVVNVLQPDLIYNGGFIRTLRVAEIAARSRIPLTIHNARLGIDSLYMAQFASFLPGVYQEYNAASESSSTWCAPSLTIKDGMLHVPRGAGLGIEIDPDLLRRAHRFQHNQI